MDYLQEYRDQEELELYEKHFGLATPPFALSPNPRFLYEGESHREALKLHQEVGNLLGQADALTNIGLVYFPQGQLEEALESFQAAYAILQRIGAKMQLQMIEQIIELLNSRIGGDR